MKRFAPYLRIAGAIALIALVAVAIWLDLSRGTMLLVFLAGGAVIGLFYLVLRLAGVVEPPRRSPPARGRFENGRFIDDSGDPPYSSGGIGGFGFISEAILDVVELFERRRRRRRGKGGPP